MDIYDDMSCCCVQFQNAFKETFGDVFGAILRLLLRSGSVIASTEISLIGDQLNIGAYQSKLNQSLTTQFKNAGFVIGFDGTMNICNFFVDRCCEFKCSLVVK
jgi:hypothetical protein